MSGGVQGAGVERAAVPAPGPRRWLGAAALVEAVSLLVLLVNLATVHLPGVAAAVGPIHGTAYLVAILLTWATPFPRRARLLVLVPGVGAWLAGRHAARVAPGPG